MICQNDGCRAQFYPSAHNQKYCSSECLRDATNRRVREKYKDDKDRLRGKDRRCRGCGSKLSRYNANSECSLCVSTRQSKITKEVVEALNVIRKKG